MNIQNQDVLKLDHLRKLINSNLLPIYIVKYIQKEETNDGIKVKLITNKEQVVQSLAVLAVYVFNASFYYNNHFFLIYQHWQCKMIKNNYLII